MEVATNNNDHREPAEEIEMITLGTNDAHAAVGEPSTSTFDSSSTSVTSKDMVFSFKDLTYSIMVNKRGVLSSCLKDGTQERIILNNVSGEFKAGTLTAIIGPSGSGKTTLLNALAGRLPSDLKTGKLYINHKPFTKSTFRRISAYVVQDDIMHENLTAREVLSFSAKLRLPSSMSTSEKKNSINNVLNNLELKQCANTRIGTPGLKRGLSGGERKRVSIGMELLTDPDIIMLDEPTTGLDSYMARSVILQLQHLAHSLGKIVICTIHQPSSATFRLFDNLLLLSKGEIAYSGPNHAAVEHFASLGYRCPADHNPAEFFLDLVQGGAHEHTSDAEHGQDLLESDREARIAMLVSANRKKIAEEIKEESPVPPPIAKQSTLERLSTNLHLRRRESKSDLYYHASAFHAAKRNNMITEIAILTYRAWLQFIRDKMLLQAKLMETIVMGLICGLIYIRPQGYDQASVQNRAGLLFFALMNPSMSALTVILSFPKEKAVFFREFEGGAYRPLSYFLAKLLADLPSNITFPFLFSVMAYWMTGLKEDIEAFLIFCLVIQLALQAALSLGLLISTGVSNIGIAITLAPMTLIPFMLMGGLFINPDSVPSYFVWIKEISPFRYGFAALMINEFTGLSFTCDDAFTGSAAAFNGTIGGLCKFQTGEDVISSYSIDNLSLAVNVVVLGSLGLCFLIGAYLFLEWTVRHKR